VHVSIANRTWIFSVAMHALASATAHIIDAGNDPPSAAAVVAAAAILFVIVVIVGHSFTPNLALMAFAARSIPC
jgi:hypothetical protein